jgi:hypothetical protein
LPPTHTPLQVTDQETAAYAQVIDPGVTGHVREPRLREEPRQPLVLLGEDGAAEYAVEVPAQGGRPYSLKPDQLQGLHYFKFGPPRVNDVWEAFVPAYIQSM